MTRTLHHLNVLPAFALAWYAGRWHQNTAGYLSMVDQWLAERRWT